MPDSKPAQKSPDPGSKHNKSLATSSRSNPDATLTDEAQERQKLQKPQSIAFDTEKSLSPPSRSKLQKALIDANAWAVAKEPSSKSAWVESKARELHEAFEKGSKAESSTSGMSETAERWSAREGGTQDLRFTLTKIFEKYGPMVMMYKGHDALGRHWVSGWKATSEQMAVVICVEREEAKSKVSVSPDAKQAEIDENWVLVENGKENSAKSVTHASGRST